jgi:DNA-binding SARP family transcriptional activator/ABC-type branched-subunit amino acid transport system substrate-binding protein/streptogramin lyase
VDYRILGPLEVSESGRLVELGGGRQRALLAILLLRRNEVVSIDFLIECLWSGKAPATAAKIVQLYVSQLRKVLGSNELVTQPPGYVLRTQRGDLDTDRFEQLLGDARRKLADEQAEAAADLLREAQAIWRGPPLADFAYEDFAQAEIGRLEELRLDALEERVEADLALGRHADLVPELETMVSAHPLRERLRGQLMVALYRCGRQAEALEEYQDARRLLDEELGLEPGQALQEVERAILRQDSWLEPPSRPASQSHDGISTVVPRRLRRRSAVLLLAGGILLGGGAAVAIIVELGGGSSTPQPVRNAVGAIDERTGRLLSYTEVGASPSDVAVGEGSVWVLNADDQTVSRIDPKTRAVVKTFATGGTPTDLAVGAGAVWVGNGTASPAGNIGDVYTASVSRVDPHSTLVTRTLALSGPLRFVPTTTYEPDRLPGVTQLAVGAGAVWAIDPDRTVSRIDPATGRLVARIAVVATHAIAAAPDGIWVIGKGPTVTRIDPRTNLAGQMIRLEASGLAGLALGGGSVWATDPTDGLVWRVEPGPNPVTRSIDVGVGATGIAFADGAVWTTNFIEGEVSRIDPRTNTVTSRIAVAATPQGVAAGDGAAWVSVGSGTNKGSLPAPSCGPITGGQNGLPDVLIASDLPLQGPQRAVTRAMTDAIGFVLRKHDFRAGRFTVGYQSCDDSTAQTGGADFFKCAANAKAYAEAVSVVGVIGPYDSSCAAVEIPITNRAAGPLALISPANTRTDLTRGGQGAVRGAPGVFYPTGVRNFVRLAAADDLFGAGIALFARQRGLRRVYVLKTGETSYGIGLTSGFVRAAPRLGLGIAGSGVWDPKASSYAALAKAIARSGADGVFLGDYGLNGGALIKALRSRLGEQVTLVASDGFTPVSGLLHEAGRAALGMYLMFPVAPVERLGPAGRNFVAAFRATQAGGVVQSGTYVPEAAQAADALLRAIARSNGTRASVLAELRRIRINRGILGGFRFDQNGDMTPALVAAFRVTGRTPKGSPLVSDFRGSAVDRLVSVPTSVLSRVAPARPR